jgi:flavin reductase (DIM6/NTAB) family NADH-FMN oxidoreductase RutF
MITCRDENGRDNVMTAAWAGTVCSDPVMVSVSIRKERYSHDIIEKSGEFVLCLTNRKLAKVTDYVGVRSGRDMDKFALEGDLHISRGKARFVNAPLINESPVCLECKVRQILELGSHDMFIGEVTAVCVRKDLLDEKGALHLERAGLVAYSHGLYHRLGEVMGFFGWSVARPEVLKKRMAAVSGF